MQNYTMGVGVVLNVAYLSGTPKDCLLTFVPLLAMFGRVYSEENTKAGLRKLYFRMISYQDEIKYR